MKLISVLFVLVSVFLGGCANPRHQNVLEGGLIGGAIGALVGDSSRAARIGAGVGMLAGATLPVHSPAYGGQPNYGYGHPGVYPPPPPGLSCQPGSVWDGRGCLYVGRGTPHPGVHHPGSWPQPMPYPGIQPMYPNYGGMPPPYMGNSGGQVYRADPRTCPRVVVPGGWRCQ